MSTLRSIAESTGLAVTTVSEILRGKPGYQPATCKRVQAVARRLHYQPSTAARQLRSGRSGLLGVLIDLDDPGVNLARLAALERAARAGGFRLVLGQAFEGKELAEFLAGGLDGVFWMHAAESVRRALPVAIRAVRALVVADRVAASAGEFGRAEEWAAAALTLMTRLLDDAPALSKTRAAVVAPKRITRKPA